LTEFDEEDVGAEGEDWG